MRGFIFIVIVGIFVKHSTGQSDSSTFPLNDIPPKFKSISCQGGNSTCPNSETCCQLQAGQYGCCPLSDGVCCNDHLHCCPKGYRCDVEHSRCQKGLEQSHDVVCPGDGISCVDGETCCQLESGDYGCCPLPDAVCCNDFSHCCPHGYRCNVGESKCEKGIISIPWFTKKTATPSDSQIKSIMSSSPSSSLETIQCPDEKSVCSEDTTCCELNNSSYGCCPYSQASCCSDKIHCCGEGYSCDESGSRCIRHLSLIPLSIFEEQICPDGITKCSLSSTCCPNKNVDEISYSCCQLAGGVCCGSDGSSCCPNEYICDEDDLTPQSNRTCSIDKPFHSLCEPTGSACTPGGISQENILSVGEEHENLGAESWICCASGYCCPVGKCRTNGKCAP